MPHGEVMGSLVARTSTGPQQRLDFGYDWRGRRIMKKVWNNAEGTGALLNVAGTKPVEWP
jgi:hypothetical protein